MADNRTLEEQLAHCDGKDCTCSASYPSECACGADWETAWTYILRADYKAISAKMVVMQCALEVANGERDTLRKRINGSVIGVAKFDKSTGVTYVTCDAAMEGKRFALVEIPAHTNRSTKHG